MSSALAVVTPSPEPSFALYALLPPSAPRALLRRLVLGHHQLVLRAALEAKEGAARVVLKLPPAHSHELLAEFAFVDEA